MIASAAARLVWLLAARRQARSRRVALHGAHRRARDGTGPRQRRSVGWCSPAASRAALAELDLPDLLDLSRELASDEESLRLLETYLDSRFPIWRDHMEAEPGDRQGGAPRSGGMTKEEAYEILGLEAGASPADIRKAHRRLMQRLHPDVGGSSFLAARINEAKDVLLSNHR
jgi:hypothetical protein